MADRIASTSVASYSTRRDASYIAAQRTGRVTLYSVIAVFGVIFAFPLYWAIATSLKSETELYFYPPRFLPEGLLVGNYAEVVTKYPFAAWFLNSSLISALTVIGVTVSSVIVAYSFARFRYPGRDLIFLLTLGTMMFPAQITLIPSFILFRILGWLNTIAPLVVPHLGGTAFTIFLLRQFIMSLPRDLDEAAVIDGANYPRILWSVLVPLMKPAVATVAVITFISAWNDFMGPMIYLNKPSALTLAVGLRFLRMQPSDARRFDHYMMAMVVMTALPCIVLFFLAQKTFVQGIVMSGIKG
jgi:multiple sugar transport system permease protein